MKPARLLLACPLLLATSCASPEVRPGESRPASQGRLTPPLKIVRVLVLPDDRIVALTADGDAALSDDGGDSWVPFGPPGRRQGEIERVDGIGMLGGELLAAAPEGVYKSADGRTWSLHIGWQRRGTVFSTASTAWFMLPGGQLDAVAGSAYLSDPGAVSAIAESPAGTLCVGSFGKGVFRSDDRGTRWEQANQGLDNQDVTALVSWGNNQWLAGTFGGGIYRSADGRTWASSSQGLDDLEINALATDGKSFFAGAHRGLFRSSDGGQSWTRVAGTLAQDNVQTLAVDSKSRLFAGTWGNGLYRSGDGGASWTTLWLRDDRRDLLSVALGKNGRLYIGARSGHVYSVLPSGNDWQNMGTPSSSLVHDLAVTGSGAVLAATPYAIYRYGTESGWKEVDSLPASEVGGIAAAPSGQLLLRTGGTSKRAEALFVSSNDGAAWDKREDSCLRNNPDPRMSTSADGSFVMMGCRCVSADGAKTWTALGDIPSGYMCKAYVGEGHAVAVGSNNFSDFGIYVSSQGGPFQRRGSVAAVPGCVAVSSSGEVVVVTGDRVMALPKGAKELSERARGAFKCTDMLVTPSNTLVMVGSGGAFASNDGGRLWTRIDPLGKAGAVKEAER